ncbi:hypothetical protein ACHQM5_019879 [Ranunculus cassubicifolius]
MQLHLSSLTIILIYDVFRSDTLGFTTYPPAYLSPQASGKNLLQGTNFVSAGSGYYDQTAINSHVITLTQQFEYYKEYQKKLAQVAGSSKAASIIKEALYIVSFGSSDFVQNYYLNPLLNQHNTPDEFSSSLVGFSPTRRIGVTSVPPFGCLPASISLFGYGHPGCVDRLNSDAQGFNKKINAAATQLKKQLPDLVFMEVGLCSGCAFLNLYIFRNSVSIAYIYSETVFL